MQEPSSIRAATIDENAMTSMRLAQQLELPYYAKYLLIAAFLASHNDVKLDKRLFVKHHGKQRKTQKSIQAKQVVCSGRISFKNKYAYKLHLM